MKTTEKAKAYDELKANISKSDTDKYGCIVGVKPSDLFPELAESEDEKIRKEIISFLKEGKPYLCPNSTKRQEWAAWLEKQGEQKSLKSTDLRTWKYIINEVLTYENGIGQYLDNPDTEKLAKKLRERFGTIEQTPVDNAWIEEYWKHHKVNNPDSYDKGDEIQFDYDGFKRFCGQFKQKPVEWSEEDKKMLDSIINVLEVMPSANFIPIKRETMIPWLESLKPRSQWKPNGEQIEALEYVIKDWEAKCTTQGYKGNYMLTRLQWLLNQIKSL